MRACDILWQAAMVFLDIPMWFIGIICDLLLMPFIIEPLFIEPFIIEPLFMLPMELPMVLPMVLVT